MDSKSWQQAETEIKWTFINFSILPFRFFNEKEKYFLINFQISDRWRFF